MPTNIPIAGPLFLHAHFDLSAACDMQVEGQMHATTGVGISGDVRLAAKYKKAGFDMPDGKKPKFQFESKAPNFELAPRPYLELEAKRASSRDKWTLDAQAGVSVSAATDIEIFGRQVRKAKEYALFDVALTKPGDEMGSAPRIVGPAVPPKTGRAAKIEVARSSRSPLSSFPPAAPRVPPHVSGDPVGAPSSRQDTVKQALARVLHQARRARHDRFPPSLPRFGPRGRLRLLLERIEERPLERHDSSCHGSWWHERSQRGERDASPREVHHRRWCA